MNEADKKELSFFISNIKELTESIITECNKWEKYPDAVFTHGYADEKVELLQLYLKRGKKVLGSD